MSTCTLKAPVEQPSIVRRVEVDFLFVDLATCSRCLGTDDSLEAALAVVKPVLEATGIAVELRKILVESEQQARELHFAAPRPSESTGATSRSR